MLIAQITDVHIGFDRGPDELNLQRLRAVVRRLIDGPNRPDLMLMTGDVTEHGDAESYARLAQVVGECPFPVWAMVGNHDERAALCAAFPDTPTADGFVQYVLDLDGLRILVLDTLEVGRHGGAFCEARAGWLRHQLAVDTTTPTYIAMHHPPFESGITWLDSDAREPWIARFADTVAGAPNLKGIVAGHLHRVIHTQWNGIGVTVCKSTAPAVALDLRPIDRAVPDHRDLITLEQPCYALHRWDGANLITHFESIGSLEAVARFDAGLQPMIQSLMGERSER